MLVQAGNTWRDTKGGLLGAVETAVARNAFAHGSKSLDARAVRRLADAGAAGKRVGSAVTLTIDDLMEHRSRLKSILRAGGL